MSTAWSSGGPLATRAVAARAAADFPLARLVYQSRAATPPSDRELRSLLTASQARNRAEGITGVLVYDKARYLQWLEGPADALNRLWRSICADHRHQSIALMGTAAAPARMFSGHFMALALRQCAGEVPLSDVYDLPPEMIEALYRNPAAVPSMLAGLTARAVTLQPRRRSQSGPSDDGNQAMSLEVLVHDLVAPRLLARYAPEPNGAPQIHPRAGELARLLIDVDPAAAAALLDTLRSEGRSLGELCSAVIEPAARQLGDLWKADDCTEWQVTTGLGRLQLALRCASHDLPATPTLALPASMPHAVLVAPSPLEQHVLGSAMASELFLRAGWEVASEFPDSDAALSRLVHERWFDVLDLSLSSVFTREHRLAQLAESIRAVHAHSRNPGLIVIVDGRLFNERPWAYANVGADAGSSSVLDVVATAQRQFAIRQSAAQAAKQKRGGVRLLIRRRKQSLAATLAMMH